MGAADASDATLGTVEACQASYGLRHTANAVEALWSCCATASSLSGQLLAGQHPDL